jgi:hypothetical protein
MGGQDREPEKICNLFPVVYNPGPLNTLLSRSFLPLLFVGFLVPLPASARDWSTSAYLGPVYDVYRYGATQFRLGATQETVIAPAWRVGVPVGFTFGDDFSSFQIGGQVSFDSHQWDRWVLYERAGALFETFWGNDRSFVAGTLDLGVGVRYQLRPKLWVGIEPLSFEVTPLTTDNVPWNVRGQVLFEVRGDW